MKTFPLNSLDMVQATALQFKAVDAVTNHFDGYNVLSLGDLGVTTGINKPITTQRGERVFADLFDAPAAIFVRGAGTGAIRWALAAVVKPGDSILVHSSPIYPTTDLTIKTMGLRVITADFNDAEVTKKVILANKDNINAVLVQHTRQAIADSYDFALVIAQIKGLLPSVPIITDDNYAALKVAKIGCQAGADISTFSCFKTLGPEGVGVLVGNKEYIDRVYKMQYSGGSQVQGHEVMAAIRGIIYAPVAFAIQAQVGEELVTRLSNGEIPEVKSAFLANAQSKVVLVEFAEEIAEEILKITPKYGGAAYPVGSESKYEFAPMIYRISGTFREADSTLEKRMIRINPMRSGPDTIIRILRQSLKEIRSDN